MTLAMLEAETELATQSINFYNNGFQSQITWYTNYLTEKNAQTKVERMMEAVLKVMESAVLVSIWLL